MTAAGALRMLPGVGGGRGSRAVRLVERNVLVYRHAWMVIFSGFFEPLFYLLSISVGLERLVGDVDAGGSAITYGEFVAPALLAASAMNGPLYDTFNVFFKMHYAGTYQAVVATPVGVHDVALGEIAWAMIRGAIYAVGFLVVMVVMGLAKSPAVLLAFPAALLVSFAFAACGVAGTTFMRSWQDFDFIALITIPLFLFSATFYPLSTYSEPFRTLVQITPLYHGVDLIRSLSLGSFRVELLGHVAYLLALGLGALAVASRRLERHLLK